jgi:hypothetical protein
MDMTTLVARALATVVLAGSLATAGTAWQLPPDVNAEGTPFLPVNINPTPIPPLVNINPGGQVPVVDVREVREMPDVRVNVIPAGCQSAAGFVSDIGTRVDGPIRLTYLGFDEETEVRLDGRDVGSLLRNAPLDDALYLGAGQAIEFSRNSLYSGCRP